MRRRLAGCEASAEAEAPASAGWVVRAFARAVKESCLEHDFVADRLVDGRVIRLLTVINEYMSKCLAIRVGYKMKSRDVVDV